MAATFNPPVGLCETCRQVKKLESSRGSVFYLCGRAATDPSFPRYPRLPVIQCRGYERGESANNKGADE